MALERLLSVVIPIGPEETCIPQGFLADLQQLPAGSEILFVTCHELFDSLYQQDCTALLSSYSVIWLQTKPGRAVQMNKGAMRSCGEFMWFLHVDSRFEKALIDRLLHNLSAFPEALHYCRLQFLMDGPNKMSLNAMGANLRSSLFGTPFGDQGFAMNRKMFLVVGGYPEESAYGEDHLFVWYARQQGYKLKCCREYLKSSARKYKQKGWLTLTCRYQYLWIKQALPELYILLKNRYF